MASGINGNLLGSLRAALRFGTSTTDHHDAKRASATGEPDDRRSSPVARSNRWPGGQDRGSGKSRMQEQTGRDPFGYVSMDNFQTRLHQSGCLMTIPR